MSLFDGRVRKDNAGLFTVEAADGALLCCRAATRLRNGGQGVKPGDLVRGEDNGDGTGFITAVLPRRNDFIRPSVCNIDLLVIAVSASTPATPLYNIDKQTALAALNGADSTAVCANCFDFLRAQVKAGEKYDVVVLDPPAFTKAHANMASACRGYKEIALSAMRLLPAGGVLATHSCSYHMPEEVFVNTVLSAAQDLHRQVRVIILRRQDIDHPVLAGYPESHYLKSLWLQMLD